jgi:hypothetical protein
LFGLLGAFRPQPVDLSKKNQMEFLLVEAVWILKSSKDSSLKWSKA